ncbi:MAG: RNA polymerase sigma factor [Eubacterium sp.]|nr:RNA polymerase sigma factor [Eubacterium sp.]
MQESEVIRLYDLYSDSIYRLAYSYLGSMHDAEDIVQDIFLKLVQRNIRIGEGKEKSYLMSMAANACKDLFRSGRMKLTVPFEEVADRAFDYSLEEQDISLFEALKKLPENYRAVIHLHYFEGYKVKEISKILRISQSGVTMRLTRGRDMLADLLKEE